MFSIILVGCILHFIKFELLIFLNYLMDIQSSQQSSTNNFKWLNFLSCSMDIQSIQKLYQILLLLINYLINSIITSINKICYQYNCFLLQKTKEKVKRKWVCDGPLTHTQVIVIDCNIHFCLTHDSTSHVGHLACPQLSIFFRNHK